MTSFERRNVNAITQSVAVMVCRAGS